METRSLGKTGWDVTVLGLGCGAHVDAWDAGEERAFTATVHRALELGMNFFDTADSYGTEEWLGKALGPLRDDVYVATKVGKYAAGTGHPLSFRTAEHVVLCCEASLYRLRMDHIDLYQCHLESADVADVFLEGFARLKQRGLIRHFGASTNDVDVLRAFDRDGDCATCQFDYNMIRPEPERGLLPYCAEADIGTIVRRPLEKGILTGTMRVDQTFTDWVRKRWNDGPEREDFQRKVRTVERLRFLERDDRTLAQASIGYIVDHPHVSCAIPGASRPSRLDGYVAALDVPLTADEMSRIRAVVADEGETA
jgi:myo-inositol catabolism protein IolS